MKEKIENLRNGDYKKLIFIGGILLIYICSFGYLAYLYIGIKDNKIEDNIIDKQVMEVSTMSDEVIVVPKIYVDIKGSVKSPGVYELDLGSRVIDLINSSGGLKKDANTRFINLSKELKDGEAIVIYSNSEIEKAGKKDIIYVNTPCVCEEVKNDGCIKETDDKSEELTGGVNINKATKEELMKLDGIGESKANSIINYRNENGEFKSIDDIKNVDGISETIYTKIKDNITI